MIKSLIGAGLTAVAMLGATSAFAAGTTSGSTVTNTATVNYQVGGVSQAPVNAVNSFTVDRRITLTVTEVGTVTTSVAPGANAQITTFQVANTSNATLDFGLSITQLAGGTAAHGGTDNFDVTGVQIFADSTTGGTVGTYDPGIDTLTFVDELAADTNRIVFVVANIPAGQANNSVAGLHLIAQAREPGVTGTQGAVVAQTAGANTAGVDTVFSDTAGTAPGDIARDGRHSDDDDYTVSAAQVTVTKQSRVVSDPLNNTTNPKLIPGAVVEYCIVVQNAAGGSAAANVAISDPLPAQTTFVAGSSFIGGTYTGTVPNGTCTGGAAGGSVTGTTYNANLGTVAAGATSIAYFQVTIN